MTRKRGNGALQEVSRNIAPNPTRKVSQKLELKDEENDCPTTGSRKPLNAPKFHGANGSRDAPVMSHSPRSYLDRLSPEILHMICDELSEDEMPALRLQCRYFIESLLELSKHPILSHNVVTVMYEPNMIEKKPRWKWEKDTSLLNLNDRILETPSPPKQSASEREWRLFHRSLGKAIRLEEKPYTQAELDLAWPIYQRYLQEQDVMISQKYASRDLLQAFQGFKNLSAIYIDYGWGLWPGNTDSNPYQDGLCKAVGGRGDYDTIRGLKETMPLLRMLSKADLGLLSLRIVSLNWRFFDGYKDDGQRTSFFRKMKHIVESLQDFELVITTWTDIEADGPEQYEDEVDECREYMRNGVLGHLLAAAPDLRKLSIAFDASDMRCPIDFKYLALDTHWPCLHTIKLDSVDAHEDDWMRFFERHATTIKRLSLRMIRLLDGEWVDVLDHMQQLLALNEMHFGDNLYGDDPVQFWSLEPPGYTSSKDESVEANRLRWALEEFMVHGGICPLLTELD